jgi:adenylate kinase family enzyme
MSNISNATSHLKIHSTSPVTSVNSVIHTNSATKGEKENQSKQDYKCRYDVIAIIGPQGSGKTTQLKKILEKTDVDFASVGEILRSVLLESENLTPELQQAKEDMTAGKIIYDEITFRILKDYFLHKKSNGNTKETLMFEGFPRTENQIKHFYELSKTYHGRDKENLKIGIIRLNLDPELAKHRCLDRADSAKSAGTASRPDDNDEAIQKRLQIYFEKMNLLENAFKENSTDIHDFHSHHEVDVVHGGIMERVFI